MPLSVIDLYRDILPKTNCKDCGFPTCMAFASMVVSEMHPIRNCPHLAPDVVAACEKELDAQYKTGKWLKRDMARDALQWAKEKSASMKIEDLPERIGGRLVEKNDQTGLELPYFNGHIIIFPDRVTATDGTELTRWEQVFIYNHLAQGGRSLPTGNWRNFVEFPNTVSKIKSMTLHIEKPLIERFKGRADALAAAALAICGQNRREDFPGSDVAMLFQPLPRVPVMLMFWDGDIAEDLEAQVKLSFDETVTDHLDIESIMFLSERLRDLLLEET